MQIVSTIRPGHTIRTQDGDFVVLGAQKLRSTYRYVVKDSAGKRTAFSREDVLQAQRDGLAQVIA